MPKSKIKKKSKPASKVLPLKKPAKKTASRALRWKSSAMWTLFARELNKDGVEGPRSVGTFVVSDLVSGLHIASTFQMDDRLSAETVFISPAQVIGRFKNVEKAKRAAEQYVSGWLKEARLADKPTVEASPAASQDRPVGAVEVSSEAALAEVAPADVLEGSIESSDESYEASD